MCFWINLKENDSKRSLPLFVLFSNLSFFIFRWKMGDEKGKIDFLHFLPKFCHFWWFFKVPHCFPAHSTSKKWQKMKKSHVQKFLPAKIEIFSKIGWEECNFDQFFDFFFFRFSRKMKMRKKCKPIVPTYLHKNYNTKWQEILYPNS